MSECVCVLKLMCKSVFLIPGNQQQTKFKHVITQSTENLVYVRVWKTFFLQISHKKKKRMSCIFLFLFHLLMCFTVFFFIHKCHSQLYLHPSAKECSKLLKQCLHMCVCICFLRLITRGGNATAKAHFGYWIFTQWGFSNAFLLFQINLSSFFERAPFQWKV